ncbi:hypothetical protein NSS64_00455 [Paenibacillus sp. FSL H8-0122]|uniref:hypothetical protein n=1 Tax=Paenibacillus sp. FSL H8-0122 TaxID=2954510 RepID=UPI0030F8AA3B
MSSRQRDRVAPASLAACCLQDSGFILLDGKLYNHNNKNEQCDELVCTHGSPNLQSRNKDGSSGPRLLSKKLLRSP